ncbi:hypothetical protein D3C75_819300 [compost metagenome]
MTRVHRKVVEVEQGPAGEGREALEAGSHPGRLPIDPGQQHMGTTSRRQGLRQIGLHLIGEGAAPAHLVFRVFVEQIDQRLAVLPVMKVCPDDLFHVPFPVSLGRHRRHRTRMVNQPFATTKTHPIRCIRAMSLN